MRRTKEDRVAKKAARDLKDKVTALRAQRRSVQAAWPWDLPYCARPGGPYCQGLGCDGCAVGQALAAELAAIDQAITNLLNPPPAPLEGELLSLVEGRWAVLA